MTFIGAHVKQDLFSCIWIPYPACPSMQLGIILLGHIYTKIQISHHVFFFPLLVLFLVIFRLELILSKTITLPMNLDALNIEVLADIKCQVECFNYCF